MQGKFYVNSVQINITQGKISQKAIFASYSRLAMVL